MVVSSVGFVDQVADVDAAVGDAAGDRRRDLGEAEVELRVAQRASVSVYDRRSAGAARRRAGRGLPGAAADVLTSLRGPLLVELGQRELRLGLSSWALARSTAAW